MSWASQDTSLPGCGRCSVNVSSLPSQAQDSWALCPYGSLTWQEEGGPGGDVDLLQMLQRLRVEEADGGARGEGHPDATARLHHVRHAHSLILVRLEALLRHRQRGVGAGPGLPAEPLEGQANLAPTWTRVRAGREPQKPSSGVLVFV